MKRTRLFFSISLIIIFSMLLGLTASTAQSPQSSSQLPGIYNGLSAADVVAALPRNETLNFNGLQGGSVNCWNPYSTSCNNAMAIAQQDNARVTMFETPYIYNMLNGEAFPLLADGPYLWDDAMTEITFTLKTAAHWSDGTPVTAEDVAYTWYADVTYQTNTWWSFKDYIDTVEVLDLHTVRIVPVLDQFGKALNPLIVESYLSNNYIIQKAWTQILEARAGGDPQAFINDPADDVVWSGPYHMYLADNTAVVLIRDDDYWGQDTSMWGKLPVPKYLAHELYINNYAGEAAFKSLKVDVSQQFIANVQDLWLVDHLPISTYLPEAPYQIGASLPTAFYNLGVESLNNPTIRRAIAIAVDYNTIIANAMTNQSATFEQVPRSLMNPSDYEQSLYDHDAVKDLQWAGSDIDGAIQLLDTAGITDTNGDGWREYDGETLFYTATCPNGWVDWMGAIDEIAIAGQRIGIHIVPNFPEWSEYQVAVTNWPIPEGYDIFMMWSDGAGLIQPWSRIRHLISSEYAHSPGNWNGNWGGYINPAADAIIQAIPGETDPTVLKQYYTDLTEIYLTDIPSFTLMYRPQEFHSVNELIWKGFPHQGDGTNPPVPPLVMVEGYGIAGLYNLYLPAQVYLPLLGK